MDKKLKARWIKALRSGKYRQCRTYLTDAGGYCCLGVLQKIVTRKNPPARWETNGHESIPEPMHFLRDNDRKLEIELANMNDRGQNFSQIADYIEANL